jgi:hypothetical protein
VSQICGTLDYVEVGSLRPNYSDVSRSKFPPRVGVRALLVVPLHSSSMGTHWRWKEATKSDAVHKGPV